MSRSVTVTLLGGLGNQMFQYALGRALSLRTGLPLILDRSRLELPLRIEVRREYEQIWSHLVDRTIEEVADLPLMSDPESLATVDVLIKMGLPAACTDENLNRLSILKAVNLCLEYGNCDASCCAMSSFPIHVRPSGYFVRSPLRRACDYLGSPRGRR